MSGDQVDIGGQGDGGESVIVRERPVEVAQIHRGASRPPYERAIFGSSETPQGHRDATRLQRLEDLFILGGFGLQSTPQNLLWLSRLRCSTAPQ
jgi:hypothetical protein